MKGIQASMTTDGRENRKLHTATSLCISSLLSFDIQRLNTDKRPPLRAQRARIIYKASSTQLIELSSRMASSRLPSPFFPSEVQNYILPCIGLPMDRSISQARIRE